MSEPLENPYVGPRPFERSDRDRSRFFGRELEARELLSLVLSERLVLFYAQSGAGKSSLINARLVYDLAERGFFVLPVGRVSGQERQAPGGEWVANVYIYSLLHTLNDRTLEGEKPAITPQMTLSQYLRLYSGQDLAAVATAQMQVEVMPQILIIDQFEELFTTQPAAWKQREDFFKQVYQALEDDPKLWVLLVMREDFTAQIDPYAYIFPGRLRARFYMQRLGPLAACDAVSIPAGLAGLGYPPREYAPGVAQELVERLTLLPASPGAPGSHDQFVEPLILQVVCFSLWERLRAGPNARPPGEAIRLEDLDKAGEIEQALVNYYESMVIAPILAEARQAGWTDLREIDLRLWIESKLITSGEQRGFVYENEQPGAERETRLMRALYEKRLLNQGQREKRRTWYELAHDRLVHPIQASNAEWQKKQSLLAQAAYAWAKSDKNPALLVLTPAIEQAVESANESDLDPLVWEFALAARKQMKRNLSVTGWGVIFPQNADPALHEALGELLHHRRRQASRASPGYYHEFEYLPGENYLDFLSRYKAPEGEPNPAAVPYYLLIVASPLEIPFAFQYQLDINYAVGRIDFERLEDYASYAHSVVTAESGQLVLPRQAVLFGVSHPDHAATRDLARLLIDPVSAHLSAREPEWQISACKTPQETGKARLSALLGGAETPALLLTSSLSVHLACGRPNQRRLEGALITGDWSGRQPEIQAHDDINRQVVFSADDLDDGAHPYGLVAFFMSSRSAGTPQFENFYRSRERSQPLQITEQDFSAALAQRLLAHPGGGALAVIGHVDEAFLVTLTGLTGASEPGAVFREGLARLLGGLPVGAALEPFNQRCATLASMLVGLEGQTQSEQQKQQYRDVELAMLDTRNYIILGDPAVRLMVAGPEAKPLRPRLTPPVGTKILRYHPQAVRRTAWSPDGSAFLALCADGRLYAWEAESARIRWTYPPPGAAEAKIVAAAWRPDGAQVAALSADGPLYLLRAADGELERALTELPPEGDQIVWSPDGAQVAITCQTLLRGGYLARLVNLASGQVEAVLRGHTQPLHSIAYAPDGSALLTASADGILHFWAPNGEEHDQWAPKNVPITARYNQRSGMLFTAAANGCVQLWSQTAEPADVTLETDPDLSIAQTDPDENLAVTATRAGVTRLWDLNGGQPWFRLPGHARGLNDLHFAPGGERLLSAGEDGSLRLWNVPVPLLGADEPVTTAIYQPGSFDLFTSGSQGGLQCWEVLAWRMPHGRFTTDSSPVSEIAFSPNGNRMAYWGPSQEIGIWQMGVGKVRSLPTASEVIDRLAFSPDNQTLLTCGMDKLILLWDVLSGTRLAELPVESYLYSARFSPDGRSLLALGRDENVYLWQNRSNTWVSQPALRPAQGARWAGFHPGGDQIVTAGADGLVRLWDNTGKETGSLKGHSGGINHVEFSPDGRQALTAGDDWTVRTWDMTTRRQTAVYYDQQMALRQAAFSSDGRIILARSDAGVSAWETASRELVLSFVDRQKPAPTILFRPDGQQVALIARGRAFLLNIRPGFLPEIGA